MIKVGEYIKYFQPEVYDLIAADYKYIDLFEIIYRWLILINKLLKRGLVNAEK